MWLLACSEKRPKDSQAMSKVLLIDLRPHKSGYYGAT
jgi:hypothetical protein